MSIRLTGRHLWHMPCSCVRSKGKVYLDGLRLVRALQAQLLCKAFQLHNSRCLRCDPLLQA